MAVDARIPKTRSLIKKKTEQIKKLQRNVEELENALAEYENTDMLRTLHENEISPEVLEELVLAYKGQIPDESPSADDEDTDIPAADNPVITETEELIDIDD